MAHAFSPSRLFLPLNVRTFELKDVAPSFDCHQGHQIFLGNAICENDSERLKRMTGFDYGNIRVRSISGLRRNPVCIFDTAQGLALLGE